MTLVNLPHCLEYVERRCTMTPPAFMSFSGPGETHSSTRRLACPRCNSTDLMRVRAPASYRLLRMINIQAKRYRCNDCLWEGMRVVRND